MFLQGPTYDPPYESPLEDLFALNVVKYLRSSVGFDKQVKAETICGKFRMDFVVYCGSKKVAFECDGQGYHEDLRDEWRDAMILGAGAVDTIYRLRGSDLTYYLEDCLFIVSQWEAEIFSERALINLKVLASDEARSHRIKKCNSIAMITYRQQSNSITPFFVWIERRSHQIPPGKRVFWQRWFDYAKKHGGGDLDKIIGKYWHEQKSKYV